MRRARPEASRKKARAGGFQAAGLFEIPNVDAALDVSGGDDSENDEDIEAELASLMSGGGTFQRRKAPAKKPVDPVQLDAMVADCLRDTPSDEDVSGDEDDPELLAELEAVAGVERQETHEAVPGPQGSANPELTKLLTERLKMYQEADEVAKSLGESAKTRRLQRGISTLKDLLQKAQKGIQVQEGDIPLPVAVGQKGPKPAPTPSSESPPAQPSSPENIPTPSRPAPAIPLNPPAPEEEGKEEDKADNSKILALLTERRDLYKRAAVAAKRNGNTAQAVEYVKIVKQFELVLKSAEEGKEVDLNSMPPPPPSIPAAASTSHQAPVPVPGEPMSVLENLEGRLAKFKEQEDAARGENNSSKMRRMGRIVKQYEDAIKTHKAGKPIEADELPTPPGFPPLTPPSKEAPQSAPSQAAPAVSPSSIPPQQVEIQQSSEPDPSPEMGPMTVMEALEKRMAKFKEQEQSARDENNGSKMRRMGRIVKQYEDAIKLHKAGKPFAAEELPTPPGFPPLPTEGSKPSAPAPSQDPAGSSTSHAPAAPPRVKGHEQQAALLLSRQKEFKEAALVAKKEGNMEKAKEYLRTSKGFDNLIEAARSGAPINMNTIPAPPPPPRSSQKREPEFEVVKASDCRPEETDDDVYLRLIKDLQHQFKVAMETRSHFKAIGDVASANKFEQLSIQTKRDMDTLKVYRSKKEPPPKFRYEKRTFTIVRCNVDLNDNDLELSIIQGINYNVPNPKEIDTYVRYELTLPNDEIKKEKTSVIYNTNNPSYQAVFLIPIARNARSTQRIFKRHAIKCEVWSKGGFFRSDSLVGTVSIKLQPLETVCTIHDSFDLMDGRKAVGGKLEVKVRLRDPILSKQVEQIEEKWLVIC